MHVRRTLYEGTPSTATIVPYADGGLGASKLQRVVIGAHDRHQNIFHVIGQRMPTIHRQPVLSHFALTA